MKEILSEFRKAVIAVLCLALILCGLYPFVVWGVAQGVFPFKANGSLIVSDRKISGSELIGQNFTGPRYFHPRPSSAGDVGYDGTSSGGNNLGPLSKKLIDSVKNRIERYRAENSLPSAVPIPADAVTSSGSGLDPHISVKNAQLQAKRIAQARGIAEAMVLEYISRFTEQRDLGIFGEPRVNVLALNLALDRR